MRRAVTVLRVNAAVVHLHRSDAPSTVHTSGRACFVFGLKRNSTLKVARSQCVNQALSALNTVSAGRRPPIFLGFGD